MSEIHVLDSETIDKIAAGEVVERPSSVVKELVENAIDAGATAITVEIKEGGISFIRVTDNGCGIEKDQLDMAFTRHATSKILNADDLSSVLSLGFRGEALSSISAVSQVEVVTKTPTKLTGTRMCLEGANTTDLEEVGAPDGTTFLVRNLFFNTPVRKKFLKQPSTEAGYIIELMEHLALSRPDISFKLMVGSQNRFHTSGNGDLKEVIYRIYGREIANNVIPIDAQKDGVHVEGYLGKPNLVRANRNYEIYFVNNRFIKSSVLSKAIEEGYKQYLMQHKFPMCVLHISMECDQVDVNVHPTKMDVRFGDNKKIFDLIAEIIWDTLRNREMIPKESITPSFEKQPIPSVAISDPKQNVSEEKKQNHLLDQFKKNPDKLQEVQEIRSKIPYPVMETPIISHVPAGKETIEAYVPQASNESVVKTEEVFFQVEEVIPKKKEKTPEPFEVKRSETFKVAETSAYHADIKAEQQNLFDEKILDQKNKDQYVIIGQVFDTYWMVQFKDQLLMIDQHAAHEKVKYERLIKAYEQKEVLSQALFPPIIVSVNGKEEQLLLEYMEEFHKLGFEIEHFGGNEYALRSVPNELYGFDEKEIFLSVLDQINDGNINHNPTLFEEKIASMSCKAAVKGNNRLSKEEAEKLIEELLTLENPYNCPHGRPTIITISKQEMEKKFKRIVS